MLNNNFAPLAGMLGIGYFMHPISIPIVRGNKIQANNERDLTVAYLLTCLSYVVIGAFGYLGFMGVYFTEYGAHAPVTERPIAQNCITMFGPTDKLAFLMRILLFFLVFFSFPILIHFFRSGIVKLVTKTPTEHTGAGNEAAAASRPLFISLTLISILIPFLITVFYPKIADISGPVGAIFGCIIVYFMPVLTHLRKLRNEADNPVLSQVVEMKWNYLNNKMYSEKFLKADQDKNDFERRNVYAGVALNESIGEDEGEHQQGVGLEPPGTPPPRPQSSSMTTQKLDDVALGYVLHNKTPLRAKWWQGNSQSNISHRERSNPNLVGSPLDLAEHSALPKEMKELASPSPAKAHASLAANPRNTKVSAASSMSRTRTKLRTEKMTHFYVQCFLHSFVLFYAVAVTMFVFWNPFEE
jgi:hypothetical protein